MLGASGSPWGRGAVWGFGLLLVNGSGSVGPWEKGPWGAAGSPEGSRGYWERVKLGGEPEPGVRGWVWVEVASRRLRSSSELCEDVAV